MKRDAGIAAALAAALLLVGVSTLQKPGPANLPAAKPGETTTAAAQAEPGREQYSSPCAEIVRRVRRFAINPETARIPPSADPGLLPNWTLPDSCYASGHSPSNSSPAQVYPKVRFAIAIAPNPVSTHLPFSFDRAVEAIQQAAQDDNYVYDASWFPWKATGEDYSRLADHQEAERLRELQQQQPGVMVFRHPIGTRQDETNPYEGGWIVFLVGEQPTAGIRDEQFENAVSWIARLGSLGPPEPLRILGPMFSGSLPSLQRDLERELAPEHDLSAYRGQGLIRVSSGDVSSGSSYRWFSNWISDSDEGYFWTDMEDDALVSQRFCQYMGALGYDLSRVAVLSEDETAFGSIEPRGKNPPTCPAVRLYYPRDLATLREAYEEQSIFASKQPGGTAEAPSTSLRGNLGEAPSADKETVHHYGGSSTPLVQESVLADITNRLSEHRIQFIILRGTNALNQIFLGEFLRRTYPEGRIVLDRADLLVTRGSWAKSLRGVMALSTYPLLTWEPDWTSSLLFPPSGHVERVFSEDTSEGVYIAARGLFRGRPGHDYAEVPIHDYGPPAWAADPQTNPPDPDNERPATWVTVIGHRGFWPIAVLNSYTLKQMGTRSASSGTNQGGLFESILPTARDRGDTPQYPGDARLGEFPVMMWVLLLATAIWSWVHFDLCRSASIAGSRRRAYFAPVPAWQHPVIMAFGGLLLAMLATAVTAASGWISWFEGTVSFYRERTPGILALWLLLVLFFAFSGTAENYSIRPASAGANLGPEMRSWRRRAYWLAAILWIGFVIVQVILVHGLKDANRVPAYWRSVNLLSGVSPLLPQVLLIAAAYLWFWYTLRGLAHFGEDRPLLPLVADLPDSPDAPGTPVMRMFTREGFAERTERLARPLGGRYLWTLTALFALLTFACRIVLQGFSLRTLGERSFGRFIFFWICPGIAAVLADTAQLWRVWGELRRLLIHLDRLPLRRTLRTLKGLEWGSIWKISGNVLEERYRMTSRQLESLRHLKNALAVSRPAGPLTPEDPTSRVAEALKTCEEAGIKFSDWYETLDRDKPVEDVRLLADFQKRLGSTAGLVMANILRPAWRREEESLLVEGPAPEGPRSRDNSPSESLIAEDSRRARRPRDGEGHGSGSPFGTLPLLVSAGEEFVALPYLAFIQNILGRMRTMVLGALWLFVGVTLAASSYPFEPLDILGGIFLTVFAVMGVSVIVVYAQMFRDATLSHLANTRPGELGWSFWFRLAAFGIGPLLGLLTTLFPSIGDFVFSWLQQGTQTFR